MSTKEMRIPADKKVGYYLKEGYLIRTIGPLGEALIIDNGGGNIGMAVRKGSIPIPPGMLASGGFTSVAVFIATADEVYAIDPTEENDYSEIVMELRRGK